MYVCFCQCLYSKAKTSLEDNITLSLRCHFSAMYRNKALLYTYAACCMHALHCYLYTEYYRYTEGDEISMEHMSFLNRIDWIYIAPAMAKIRKSGLFSSISWRISCFFNYCIYLNKLSYFNTFYILQAKLKSSRFIRKFLFLMAMLSTYTVLRYKNICKIT